MAKYNYFQRYTDKRTGVYRTQGNPIVASDIPSTEKAWCEYEKEKLIDELTGIDTLWFYVEYARGSSRCGVYYIKDNVPVTITHQVAHACNLRMDKKNKYILANFGFSIALGVSELLGETLFNDSKRFSNREF